MCMMLIQMPNGISLQMQDLFFTNSGFFFLLQELFLPDLSGQSETSSTLSQPESHWQACGWQLCLKLLFVQTLRHVGHLPPTALTGRPPRQQMKSKKEHQLQSLATAAVLSRLLSYHSYSSA